MPFGSTQAAAHRVWGKPGRMLYGLAAEVLYAVLCRYRILGSQYWVRHFGPKRMVETPTSGTMDKGLVAIPGLSSFLDPDCMFLYSELSLRGYTSLSLIQMSRNPKGDMRKAGSQCPHYYFYSLAKARAWPVCRLLRTQIRLAD